MPFPATVGAGLGTVGSRQRNAMMVFIFKTYLILLLLARGKLRVGIDTYTEGGSQYNVFFCHTVTHMNYATMCSAAISALADDSCPAFGTDFSRSQSTNSATGLWLNFDTPAQCTGTAVQWRFCYYLESTTKSKQEVWLRVYRKSGASGTYDKEADYTVSVQSGNTNDAVCDGGTPSYCCDNITVNYQIQENDIIGVCVRDTGGHGPLYSVDEDASA